MKQSILDARDRALRDLEDAEANDDHAGVVSARKQVRAAQAKVRLYGFDR